MPTSLQFISEIKRLSSSPQQLAAYLQRFPPSSLSQLFRNQLEGDHIVPVVTAFSLNFSPQAAVHYLQSLTSVSRFDSGVLFLTDADNESIAQVFGKLKLALSKDVEMQRVLATLSKKFKISL